MCIIVYKPISRIEKTIILWRQIWKIILAKYLGITIVLSIAQLPTNLPKDHSSITSSKRWVGGVRNWQFSMIYSTVNHQKLPLSNPTHPPLWRRNTWMIQNLKLLSSSRQVSWIFPIQFYEFFHQYLSVENGNKFIIGQKSKDSP